MLPIALKSFHIKGYRGITDTQVDNIPPDTQWIFLTGENGFGKTSVLQALAVSLSGFSIDGDHDDLSISLSFFNDGEIHSDGKIPNPKKNIEVEDFLMNKVYLREVIAYGSTRLRVSASSAKEVLNKYPNISSLFSNEALLADIEENFKDWALNYSDGFYRLENIFKTLIPRLVRIAVIFNKQYKTSEVKYFEKDEEGISFDTGITFNELAAGYKNILAMIGDMIIRLSKYDYQTVDDFTKLKGIVLIDEIDLHLHPKYQKLFVQKLSELFPKIQFIVSTHSPIPLLGAPKNSVIINVSRTREEGIKAELLDIDFSVLTPNSILSSPIFGFQDLIPESKSDDKMIRTEDTFQEVEFNDQLKKNINEFLTKERQEELLKLIKVKQKS
jgi:predicted ATP-binding protein involved in virulence